jgi:metal-responsive CopG/Arc/MetJ family transcriptional regulator
VKTAVSLPDPLFQTAERMARRLGLSRSRLYAQALEAFVEARRSQGVRERLDAVYRVENSRLDPVLEWMQIASLSPEDW